MLEFLIVLYVLSILMVIGIEVGLVKPSSLMGIVVEIIFAPLFCAFYIGLFLGKKV